MKIRSLFSLLFLAVGVALFSGCTLFGPTAEDGRPLKEFRMTTFTEMKDGKYFPQFSVPQITVEEGDHVRIFITNTKGAHDFKIDELNVYAETPLEKETVIDFVADKTGTFEYYCTKPGHRQNGHVGKIIVE